MKYSGSDTEERIMIIAEAGVNHNGSIDLAKKLVDAAAEAGADVIKFQTFRAETLVTRAAPKALYQFEKTGQQGSQFDMLKRLELPYEAHHDLMKYSWERKIIFLSAPFDLESIDFLNVLGLEIFKIPSGEITNLPYLRKIGALRKRIILSTGMSYLKEIEDALAVLVNAGMRKDQVTVLHCNTEYPTPYEDVNLRAMAAIRDALNVKVGYSDHTTGIEIPVAAAALGARVIEKHFTLDQAMEGPDHKASLEPPELARMVKAVRNIELALGNGNKQPSPSEMKNIVVARKSIVALRSISSEELFSESNITVRRPGNGISPMEWDYVLGKRAKRDFSEGDLIEL
jgi:N,N'-diacetyllegionaminate synthase